MRSVDVLHALKRALQAALAVITLTAAQYPNQNGWQNLQWGMGAADVERLVPGIQKIKPRTDVFISPKGQHFFVDPGMLLYLPEYDLDGEPAVVTFIFDGDHKLAEVRVNSDGYVGRDYANRILKALRAKYGKPAELKADKGTRLRACLTCDREAKWVLRNTIMDYDALWYYANDQYGDARDILYGEISLEIAYKRGPISAVGKL